MNGLQGCNLSLSMSRRAMTSSAGYTCVYPGKKNTGCWVMRREQGRTADGRWSEGWNRNVHKKQEIKRKNNPASTCLSVGF